MPEKFENHLLYTSEHYIVKLFSLFTLHTLSMVYDYNKYYVRILLSRIHGSFDVVRAIYVEQWQFSL